MQVTTSTLKLADVIRLTQWAGAFADCIVSNIADGQVHIVRPYMTHPGFSHTGGVIVFTGHEHFSLPVSDEFLVELVQEGGPLK